MGPHFVRLIGGLATSALALAACGGGSGDGGAGSGDATPGGTIYSLSSAEQIKHLDPQRNYTDEDLAFASAYSHRTLTAYKYSDDEETAGQLVGDLATDTGTSEQDGKVWKFTLRDGVKWEGGSAVT